MAGSDEKIIDIYKTIGTLFGTGGQIINDVGDFCLAKNIVNQPEKDYQDQYADLKKGTMTLPLFDLIDKTDINLENFIGKDLSYNDKNNLLSKMVENRCFDRTIKITNSYKRKIIKKLDELPKTHQRDQFKMIVKLFFGSNKFYTNLRKEHNYKW